MSDHELARREHNRARCREYYKRHQAELGPRSRWRRREWWNNRTPEERSRLTFRKNLRLRYGLTLDDYDKLFLAQQGKCALCRRTQKRRLFVDHNHETGKVRGLLCTACNMAGSRMDADSTWADRVKEYFNG